MKTEKIITKEMIVARLVKNGQNPVNATKLVDLHFDNAQVQKSKDLKHICYFIATIA